MILKHYVLFDQSDIVLVIKTDWLFDVSTYFLVGLHFKPL